MIDNAESFFVLPDEICRWIRRSTKTISEDRVLRCLVRFSLGFRQETCQLSNSFIGEWTGISRDNVPRVINRLIKKGLVCQIKKGEMASRVPSIWHIPFLKSFIKVQHKKLLSPSVTELLVPVVKSGDGQAVASVNSNATPVVTVTTNKENKNKISKNTLSANADQSGYHSIQKLSFTQENLTQNENLETSQNYTIEPSSLVEVFNKSRGPLPEATKLTPSRRRAAQARLREVPDLTYWEKVVKQAANNPFLSGQNARGWKANFDFILRPDSHVKILEGQYGATRAAIRFKTIEEILG